MITKSTAQIDKADIEDLVNNQVMESRFLEYKEMLPGGTDDEKKEFLADVSAFANAAGGRIIYGVSEKRDSNGKTTGFPEKAVGLPSVNQDAELRRLESMIRDGLSPRVHGIQLRFVEGFSGGPVLVIGIPRSWVSPHMITFKGSSKFYSRTSSGKYPLDVSEIRTAFVLSETLSERIKVFRQERIAKIIESDLPMSLQQKGFIALHLIPVGAFSAEVREDFVGRVTDKLNDNLSPLYGGRFGYSKRFNLDGILTTAQTSDQPICISYLQLFRNGIVETVDSALAGFNKNSIPSMQYEKEIIECTKRLVALEQALEIPPPYLLTLCVHGVKGKEMGVGQMASIFRNPTPIDRDTLFLPEIMIEDMNAKPEVFLRPAFDAFWQAAGWPKSRNYDDKGNWVGQQ